MNPDIYFERLEEAAQHAETGTLGHEEFDFDAVNRGFTEPNTCGTAGCLMGEFPIIWPESWEFYRLGVRLKGSNRFLRGDLEEWFGEGLSKDAARHLFYSNSQRPKRFGGKMLGSRATRYEVAAGIRAFIAKF